MTGAKAWKRNIIHIFPQRFHSLLEGMESDYPLEEIRIRINGHIRCVFGSDVRTVGVSEEKYMVNQNDCLFILEKICCHSLYAWEEELRNGFITLSGGYRVGLCGKAIIEGGRFKRLANTTYFNIRIAHECKGCADALMKHIVTVGGAPLSTLLISPPGGGKTTMLRDIARQLSYGLNGAMPCKVSIIDERAEIAGCWQGVPQNDVGPNSDVLDSCPKTIGIRLLLRTMSPDVIVTDEIGGSEDAEAILEASNCGAAIIATAHGSSVDSLSTRQALKRLINDGVFRRIITLRRRRGVSELMEILHVDSKDQVNRVG